MSTSALELTGIFNTVSKLECDSGYFVCTPTASTVKKCFPFEIADKSSW